MYIGLEEIREAAKNLSPSALKLYLYFAENEDDWDFFLSPKDFQNTYDVAESTYRKAKTELIEKGYIIELEGNKFDFFTTPTEAEIPMEDIKEQLNRTGACIRRYNEDIYNKYYNKLAQLKELSEPKKRHAALDILKEMQEELKQLEKEFTFDF